MITLHVHSFTFTFTLSLSHFHFHTFTLSHFHFHTFTISLSHFHLSPGSSHSLWNLRVQCFSHHRLPLLPCSSRRRTHQESFIFFVVIFSFHQNQLHGSLLLPSCPQLRWESVAFLPEMVFLSFKGEKIYLGETNKGVFPLQERAIQPSALQVFFLLSHNPIQSNGNRGWPKITLIGWLLGSCFGTIIAKLTSNPIARQLFWIVLDWLIARQLFWIVWITYLAYIFLNFPVTLIFKGDFPAGWS